jgi:hypothetical protein
MGVVIPINGELLVEAVAVVVIAVCGNDPVLVDLLVGIDKMTPSKSLPVVIGR